MIKTVCNVYGNLCSLCKSKGKINYQINELF